MYRLNVFKLLYSFQDELEQVKISERMTNVGRAIGLLIFLTIFIYSLLGYFGIGSQLILHSDYTFSQAIYESNKFWFIIGRALFGFLFAVIVIFLPSFLFKWLFNDVDYLKLVVMQLAVLVVLLVERLTWLPLVTVFSLDSFASPFSFGVIASFLTSKSWIVYFFGSISLFQLFIIVFQVRFLSALLNVSRGLIISTVIFLQFIYSWFIAVSTFISPYLVEGWF